MFKSKRKKLLQLRLDQAKSGQEDSLLHDPIEDDFRYAEILKAAEIETDEKLSHRDQGMGFCHLYWATKQDILHEKYGVIWFSPSDMNPGVLFD